MTDKIDTDALAAEMLAAARNVPNSSWRSDDISHFVWAVSEAGDFQIVQARGWGHYTGKGSGGLGLSNKEGIAIQKSVLDHVAGCDPDNIRAILTERTRFKAALTEIAKSPEHADYLRRIAEDALGEGK